MGQVYNITNTRDSEMKEHCSFSVQHNEEVFDETSTYAGVLKIFKEAFHTIDFLNIIRKA